MESQKSKYTRVTDEQREAIYRARIRGDSYPTISRDILKAENKKSLAQIVFDAVNQNIKTIQSLSIQSLFSNGKLPPTAAEITKKCPGVFYSKPRFKNYLKKNAKHMKRHGITIEEMKEIRDLKKEQDTNIKIYCNRMAIQATWPNSRVPEFNNYPLILSANNDLGDFQRPDLAPGEISPLRLLEDSQQIFNKNMVEIGLTDTFVDMVKLLIIKEGIYEKIPWFVGKHQRSFDYYERGPRKIIDDLIKDWSINRYKKESGKHNDLTFFYPATEDKLDEMVEYLRRAGLEHILSNLPEFLGLEADEDGTVHMVITELNFFGISINEPEDGTVLTRDEACLNAPLHVDMTRCNTMCTVLIPLDIPVCEKPPLVVADKNDTIRKGYTYRKGAALAFKADEWHGTNLFGRTNSYRFVLSAHIGHYNDELDDHLSKKTFKMPAAKRVTKNCGGKKTMNDWKEKHKISIRTKANKEDGSSSAAEGGCNGNSNNTPQQLPATTAADAESSSSQQQQQQTPPPPPPQQQQQTLQQQPLMQQTPFPIFVPPVFSPFFPYCIPGMTVTPTPYPPVCGFPPPLPVVQRDDAGDDNEDEEEMEP